MENSTKRPEIYEYLDYRQFLKDWFAFLKKAVRDFSIRSMARQSGISESYLSMVLSGERTLSAPMLEKMTALIGLDPSQQSYLGWLRTIAEADHEEERLEALKKIQRFRQYRAHNSNEIETYEYLTHWYYVAIREMSALSEFSTDPKWIRARLKVKVPLKDVRAALEFLQEHGFIEVDSNGKCARPSKRIHGKTGMLRPALTKFHRELLTLACDSIESTPSELRNISAHTAAIPLDRLNEVKKILEEARSKISELSAPDVNIPAEVYHFSFLAFPLTKSGKGDKGNEK